MNTPVIIKREDLRLNFDEFSHGKLNKNIVEIILMAKQHGMSLSAIRNLLVIVYSLGSKQLHTSQQLELFDENFGDITKPVDLIVTFSFLWKDFLDKGSKNYKQAEKGLVELSQLGGKKEFINEKGDVIRVYASIISDITVNERQKGVRFNMNIAWYRMFLEITKYNKFSNRVIFGISSVNVMLWYIYLKSLPNKDMKSGQHIKYHTFTLSKINEIFNCEEKHWSKIEERFLIPARKNLDEIADISFYYVVKNSKVIIEIYDLSPSVPMTHASNEALQISRTLTYQRRKNKLSLEQAMILESLYKKYTYPFVKKAISRKKSLETLVDADYIKEVHKLILNALADKK